MPKRVLFVDGEYEGQIFTQGAGPGKRVMDGDGNTRLINSQNFWYNNGKAVSGQWLERNKSMYVEP